MLPVLKATPGWKVRETPTGTELVTPYGIKEIVGDMGANGNMNYRIEFPLEDLKPPTQPEMSRSPSSPENEEWEEWTDEEETASGGSENSCHKENREMSSLPPKVVVEYDDADRYVVEANRLYNRGKFYDATAVVEELLRKKPDHVRGWVMKGSLMKVQGQKDLAKSAYEQALKLDPNNLELKKLVENNKK